MIGGRDSISPIEVEKDSIEKEGVFTCEASPVTEKVGEMSITQTATSPMPTTRMLSLENESVFKVPKYSNR